MLSRCTRKHTDGCSGFSLLYTDSLLPLADGPRRWFIHLNAEIKSIIRVPAGTAWPELSTSQNACPLLLNNICCFIHLCLLLGCLRHLSLSHLLSFLCVPRFPPPFCAPSTLAFLILRHTLPLASSPNSSSSSVSMWTSLPQWSLSWCLLQNFLLAYIYLSC